MEDKGTKDNCVRYVPLIEEVRQLVLDRLQAVGRDDPDARLFRGPRGGRIVTGVLRDSTHWDEVVAKLGYEHLRRHDLRHTGLTWFADAGVSLHVLQRSSGMPTVAPLSGTCTRIGARSPARVTSSRSICGPVLVPLCGWSDDEESPSGAGRRGILDCRADRI
ncbi:tyrosine-type recombinase/integrase [Nocardia farcinica]|uniref:tyrosine-type recombinase/integrase n=1 Tax=Nocardia farcinica TaxID=37329 RepID=UPI002455199E|nr:tyrosine-type recombinase/integrase [Nocardia farcinica]